MIQLATLPRLLEVERYAGVPAFLPEREIPPDIARPVTFAALGARDYPVDAAAFENGLAVRLNAPYPLPFLSVEVGGAIIIARKPLGDLHRPQHRFDREEPP